MHKLLRTSVCFGGGKRLISTTSVKSKPIEKTAVAYPQLPPLPIPTLNQTLSKCLRTIKPIVTAKEYDQTEKVAREFSKPNGVGEQLQRLLEERASRTENWLSDWWLENAYLAYRLPVVVHSSPGMVFAPQTFNSFDEHLRFAAKLTAGAVDYKLLIDRGMPLEKMAGKPLDMSQYSKIMSTCRIPGVPCDNVKFFGLEPNPPKHIVVIRRNNFFKLDVLEQNGSPISESQILTELHNITSKTQSEGPAIGVLTTEHRDTWGNVYNNTLMTDSVNSHSVQEIQRALFVLCLDKPNAASSRSQTAAQCIHGLGSKQNAGNRWFDKTVQLIVGESGEVGMTYEHSPSEGPPIAVMMDHCANYMKSNSVKAPSYEGQPKSKQLRFKVSSDLENAINTASSNLDKLAENLDVKALTFSSYGKNFIKMFQMSPDSYIQQAIQLAFYRLHKAPGVCYESGSTRQYQHGRTETIRSCSAESLQFCSNMVTKASCTDSEKINSLRQAIEGHKQYVNEALSGYGVDRHLLGLKLTALENRLPVPEFYKDPGYAKSIKFRLSTSQVAGKSDSFMAYGPLEEDGYGCCYNPRDDSINFGISSFKSCSETDAKLFATALTSSLIDMRDILVKTQRSKL